MAWDNLTKALEKPPVRQTTHTRFSLRKIDVNSEIYQQTPFDKYLAGMVDKRKPSLSDRRILWYVFLLTLGYLIVEILVGLYSNSLALLADAVHMFTDAGALALAVFASWIAEKSATPEKTYGYYRVEILAALSNALILTGSSLFLIYEAYRRLQEPGEVIALPMMIAAVIGLAVNVVGLWLLRSRSKENLNIQGAFYEVVKDALGSIGVLVAGVVILTTGFTLIDPIVSIMIALLILPRTWKLLSNAVNVLLEATPAGISLGKVRPMMVGMQGVGTVHDLHVWTITSGMVAMSGHVVLEKGVEREKAQAILTGINEKLKTEFGIQHTTIQVEFQDIEAGEPQL